MYYKIVVTVAGDNQESGAPLMSIASSPPSDGRGRAEVDHSPSAPPRDLLDEQSSSLDGQRVLIKAKKAVVLEPNYMKSRIQKQPVPFQVGNGA